MDLTSLNDAQKEAVTADSKKAILVLAGAGSGKTRVLTYRLAYLISEGLYKPSDILALTFTNKAAREMSDRVISLLSSDSLSGPTVGTFHSVCARILRSVIDVIGYKKSFTIIDSDDQQRILKRIFKELGIDKEIDVSYVKILISQAKNLLQTPDEFSVKADKRIAQYARKIYKLYQDYLFKENALDFDDLIFLTVKIFQNFPKILQRYQDTYKYILVDEYQDTNSSQFALLKLLTPNNRIFVVGDDAQSIYGFRGSDVAIILGFKKHFKNSIIYKLEKNYRSTKNILAVAESVIAQSTFRMHKTLYTDNEVGSKVSVLTCDNDFEEATMIIDDLLEKSGARPEKSQPTEATYSILDMYLKPKKSAPKKVLYKPKNLAQFCVLYRTHAQSRVLEEAFVASGMPYRIIGGLRFYERAEIKDFLAFARLGLNFKDRMSLLRVINNPPKGLGDKAVSKLFDSIDAAENIKDLLHKISAEFTSKQTISVKDFFDIILDLQTFTQKGKLTDFFKHIYKQCDFFNRLSDGTEKGQDRIDNVKELIRATERYGEASWQDALPRFLEEVALNTQDDGDHSDKVSLMTLHSVKGLEFDHVYFAGLEEGIIPHNRSLSDPKNLDEEVRLAYVGMTRARKNLTLSHARRRGLYGSQKDSVSSRFIRHLPKDAIKRNISDTFLDISEENGLMYETFYD